MEHRFGYDFSSVRIHRGEAATHSARDIGARAYTMGPHIVFDSAEFAPDRNDNR